jgi:hypothetical protein
MWNLAGKPLSGYPSLTPTSLGSKKKQKINFLKFYLSEFCNVGTVRTLKTSAGLFCIVGLVSEAECAHICAAPLGKNSLVFQPMDLQSPSSQLGQVKLTDIPLGLSSLKLFLVPFAVRPGLFPTPYAHSIVVDLRDSLQQEVTL